MSQIDEGDAFDAFLAQSLAPPDRIPDKQFLARVSQQMVLDKLRRRARAKMLERLGVELLSIVAVGAGLLAAGGGTRIAESAGNVPAAVVAGMMIVFAFWVALVSRQQRVRRYN